MANLGICRRCDKCQKFRSVREDASGQRVGFSDAWCYLAFEGITWDSEVPDDCPYRLEHIMSKEYIDDLAEDVRIAKGDLDETQF